MNSRENDSKKTVAVAVIGGLIVILVLVIGTVRMGQKAKQDTEDAVRSVSLLYLDELAGRREQVVAENLQDRISDMKTALELMTEDDLMTEENRQAYQKKMKALFGLEKFASWIPTAGYIPPPASRTTCRTTTLTRQPLQGLRSPSRTSIRPTKRSS